MLLKPVVLCKFFKTFSEIIFAHAKEDVPCRDTRSEEQLAKQVWRDTLNGKPFRNHDRVSSSASAGNAKLRGTKHQRGNGVGRTKGLVQKLNVKTGCALVDDDVSS